MFWTHSRQRQTAYIFYSIYTVLSVTFAEYMRQWIRMKAWTPNILKLLLGRGQRGREPSFMVSLTLHEIACKCAGNPKSNIRICLFVLQFVRVYNNRKRDIINFILDFVSSPQAKLCIFSTPPELKPTHMKEMWSASNGPAYGAKPCLTQNTEKVKSVKRPLPRLGLSGFLRYDF